MSTQSRSIIQSQLEEIYHQPQIFTERSLVATTVLRLSGNPYVPKYVTRFIERIEINSKGCWEWTNTLNNKGYARMGMYRRLVLMHRWSYLLFKGAIPQGLELDHTCTNPCCVNPDHLEAVTHRENNRRSNGPSGIHSRTVACPQGHPLNEENTYRNMRKGSRECRICKTKRTIESNRRMQVLRKGRIA